MEDAVTPPYNALLSPSENSQFGIIVPSCHISLVSVTQTSFPIFDMNVIWSLLKITSELSHRTALSLNLSV